MKTRRPLPSIRRLLELFTYNPKTGRLKWRQRPLSSFPDIRTAHNWNTKYAGMEAGCYVGRNGKRLTFDGQSWAVHRICFKIATGLEPSHIDHKNLNTTDNRIENLRAADNTTNAFNSPGRKNSAAGLKGVTHHKNCKYKQWRAVVTKNGIVHSGGYFRTKEAAFKAASELREKLHGEFVCHGANV